MLQNLFLSDPLFILEQFDRLLIMLAVDLVGVWWANRRRRRRDLSRVKVVRVMVEAMKPEHFDELGLVPFEADYGLYRNDDDDEQ